MADATIHPWQLIKRYRRYYLLGGIALIATNLCDTALPLILKVAIDDLVLADGLIPVAALGAVYLGLVGLLGLFRYFWRYYFVGASHRIGAELRERLFCHLERLPQAFFQGQRTGDIMSRATNDVQAVRFFFAIGLLLTLDSVMYLVIIPPAMALLAPRLAMYTLLPLLGIPLFVWWMGRVVHRRFLAVQERFGKLSSVVEETIGGIRVVKGYVDEEARAELFREQNDAYLRETMRLQIVQGLFQPAVSTLMALTLVAVILLGGRMAIAGEISIGDFVAFQLFLLKLSWPMRAVGMTVNIYQRGLASLKRLRVILGTDPEIQDDERTDPDAEVVDGAIELAGLTFRYPVARHAEGDDADGTGDAEADVERRPALVDVNLSIAPGETVALVGPVGGGKSTLLRLLPRLFEAPDGALAIDGRPVAAYPLEALRSAIGFVPQETFLFADTIANNVAFGAPDTPEDAVRTAIERAGVWDDVAALPDGLDSPLGERGVNLSGGQRQRLAIARAIVLKPKLLLLDDCLSAVDTETEARILQGLRKEREGRTTLIASHRLAAVKDADRIVCLDQGRIVDVGTHDDLLARGGLYRALWDRQALEATVEEDLL